MTPPDAEAAAALLRSLGWSVVAPVSALPNLGIRDMDALADISTYGAQLYWRRPASMRKLAAHRLVERHPRNPGTEASPAWRITDAGKAMVARTTGARP